MACAPLWRDVGALLCLLLAPNRTMHCRSRLLRKRQSELGCLLADLCFGAHQEGGNVGDGASVLYPVAKREQVLLGPLFAGVEHRLCGYLIHPNSLALSLASLQAAVRKSARLIETRLSSFL